MEEVKEIGCIFGVDDAIAFYDSPADLRYKMDYVIETGLGGISVWELGIYLMFFSGGGMTESRKILVS